MKNTAPAVHRVQRNFASGPTSLELVKKLIAAHL